MHADELNQELLPSRGIRGRKPLNAIGFCDHRGSKHLRSPKSWSAMSVDDESANQDMNADMHDLFTETLGELGYDRAGVILLEGLTCEQLGHLLLGTCSNKSTLRSKGRRFKIEEGEKLRSIIVCAVARALQLPRQGTELLQQRLRNFRAAVVAAAMFDELARAGVGAIDAMTWRATTMPGSCRSEAKAGRAYIQRLTERAIAKFVFEHSNAIFNDRSTSLRGRYDEGGGHWILEIAGASQNAASAVRAA